MNYSKQKNVHRKNTLVDLYSKLNDVDAKLGSNPQSEVLQKERAELSLKIELMERQNAKAAQIRAKVKWIEEGEKNTKYFLGLEKCRANSKIMTEILDENKLVTNQSDILKAQKKFFSRLYEKRVPSEDMYDKVNTFLRNTNMPHLSERQRNDCEGIMTEQELLEALKGLKNGSSPGCDGITVEFLKVFWAHLKGLLSLSLNLAFEKGMLSTTQKRAIITLIHKGKELPRNDLKHWRPISLTNSDYKLLAKALAMRLNLVIHDLVSEEQFGYIKGRQSASLIRLIDDLIENMNIENKPGLLVSIDYSQAFDRISKEFMICTFEKFGFGPDFMQWVKVIMAESVSCVSYSGWLSEFFRVDSGIRQGCPFSPLAFVLAVEILAIKIRESRHIKGIKLDRHREQNISSFLKIAMYADDVTLFLSHEQDMHQALSLFHNFSEFSGLEINKQKSVAMWLGSKKHCGDTFYGFSWKRKIKILGIHFSNDKPASDLNENWEQRIENMKRLISLWEKRNLSLIGKVRIIKTFLISQIVYIMQALIIPEKVLTKINQILFRFLWRKENCNRRAFEKVKRSVVCSGLEKGGLKMLDVRQMQTSFILQWVLRLCQASENEKWACLPRKTLSNVLGNFKISVYTSVKSKEFKGINNLKSSFWKCAL